MKTGALFIPQILDKSPRSWSGNSLLGFVPQFRAAGSSPRAGLAEFILGRVSARLPA